MDDEPEFRTSTVELIAADFLSSVLTGALRLGVCRWG